MENTGKPEEKKEITIEEKPPHRVSKFVWFPFIIVFFLCLALVILSFFETLPWQDKLPLNIKFSQNLRLIMLGVLLAISLLIPFWAYSMSRARTKYNYPLGLPRGSIRALVTLILAAAYVALAIKGSAFEDARNLFILVAVLYYFSRIAESNSNSQ